MKKLSSIAAIALIILLNAVTPSNAEVETPKLKVVTTFTILWDMAHQIGGDKIDLYNIVGPDVDMHEYQLTPSDIAAVADANLLIVNGLGFEPWLGKLIKSSGFKGKVIRASAKANLLRLTSEQKEANKQTKYDATGDDEDRPGDFDPHAWQNISNARTYATNISAALFRHDKANESFYKANAEQYRDNLTSLERWAELEFRKVPEQYRKMVTTHDGMNYLAHSYRIKLFSPIGISTADKTSAADLAKAVDWIRLNGVKALFLENVADRRFIDQIAKETGITPGGQLYTDALHNEKGRGDTYESMFRYNVETIISAMTR